MSRTEFLNIAGIAEGGLVFLAFGFGWFVGVSPTQMLNWDLQTLAVGLLATIPMCLAIYVAKGPREIVIEAFGEALCHCRSDDLIFVAALAGIGEEFLFRGVLEPWIAAWSPMWAFLLVNTLFGLVHAASLTYFLLATIMGMYFSWLTYGIGEPNLWRAVVAHGAYDAVALVLIARECRRRKQERNQKTED